MHQSAGKGVARADGIRQPNGKAGRFNIFAVQQERAAFSATRNTDGFKFESAGGLAAESLKRVGCNSTYLFDQGEFLMAELEHVRLLNESTDQLRRIRLGTKIHVIEAANRGRRVQQSPCEITRRNAHLLQGAEVNPVWRGHEQSAEIVRTEGREVISGGPMDAVLRSSHGIE